MTCPYCNEEMEKGYIDQNDLMHPLEWSPLKQDDGFFASKKRNVKLTSLLKGGTVTAYRCASCKKIIIDENLLEV